MKSEFEIAAGTITGRDHIRVGKNNQDAFCVSVDKDFLIAVVCDGCSDGACSEVGANLGARLFTTAIKEVYKIMKGFEEIFALEFLEKARQIVLSQINNAVMAMGDKHLIVNDYFLFTVVGVLIENHSAWFFSNGDGAFFIDDKIMRLEPFPDNAPPYFSYELLDTSLRSKNPGLLRLQIHKVPNINFLSCAVATDGIFDLIAAERKQLPGKSEFVGPISQFWKEDRYFSNRDMIRRRLTLINREAVKPDWENQRLIREPGLLPDDTTLVVIRRKPYQTVPI